MDRFAALIRKIFQGHLAELNIWDRELTRDEVQAMSSCRDFPKDNVVAWRAENFKLVGLDRNVGIRNSAANRLIGEVVQSRRRPLLGPSPG